MLYSLIFEKGEGGAESRWVLFNLVRRIYFGLKRLTQPSERKKKWLERGKHNPKHLPQKFKRGRNC